MTCRIVKPFVGEAAAEAEVDDGLKAYCTVRYGTDRIVGTTFDWLTSFWVLFLASPKAFLLKQTKFKDCELWQMVSGNKHTNCKIRVWLGRIDSFHSLARSSPLAKLQFWRRRLIYLWSGLVLQFKIELFQSFQNYFLGSFVLGSVKKKTFGKKWNEFWAQNVVIK